MPLYNRRELFSFLDSIDIFSDNKYYMAMFDIDRFKNVNDNYGHIFGDIALRKVAEELQIGVNQGKREIAARYSEEEIALILACETMEEANCFMRRSILVEIVLIL
ncbi:MAG: diguanylate cyclase [Eubacterium sp.]|nr:diguanylate cyclase [Eubacterium sp.]